MCFYHFIYLFVIIFYNNNINRNNNNNNNNNLIKVFSKYFSTSTTDSRELYNSFPDKSRDEIDFDKCSQKYPKYLPTSSDTKYLIHVF